MLHILRRKVYLYPIFLSGYQEFLIKPYEKGDTSNAIAFVEYLISQYPKSRIALIWDGASYHRSHEFKAHLNNINQGLNEDEWKVTCIRFAPNDPTQNPVEDIWLYAKNFIREFFESKRWTNLSSSKINRVYL
ncbi:transposase [Calothrix sp. CCY 0018]|uniref:transposase n=1 Tax=Calothrix sp. CCY 0018 TaxID=3103864 RepID=UPI0039C74E29